MACHIDDSSKWAHTITLVQMPLIPRWFFVKKENFDMLQGEERLPPLNLAAISEFRSSSVRPNGHIPPNSRLSRGRWGRRGRKIEVQATGPISLVPYYYLLLFRFFVILILCVAGGVAAFFQGWVDKIIEVDRGIYLCAFNTLIFLCGIYCSGSLCLRFSRELNMLDAIRSERVKTDDTTRVGCILSYTAGASDSTARRTILDAFGLQISSRISPLSYITGLVVFIGLTGTILGFIMALSGVSPDSVADVSLITPMLAKFLGNMGFSLYKSLLGSVYAMILGILLLLVRGGAAHLVSNAAIYAEVSAQRKAEIVQ